ncbi:hypothetical protein GJAV_G00275430 [Gymnothorax javanicus]|nr:hypothetical protein GJAV_G00275430 [Gymnothorax javanicus]
MRQFLQNAIQLQLFKQFIDGHLELLNSGQGFSDVFEEEISAEFFTPSTDSLGSCFSTGSDSRYHQWLSTVKKGSGAIFNSVKTKANPSMKTVYKFENGYMASIKDGPEQATKPPFQGRKFSLPCDQRQPITEHLEQAFPPQLVENPLQGNAVQNSESTERSEQSTSLTDLAVTQGEQSQADKGAESSPNHTARHSLIPGKVLESDLLGNIFWSLEGEPESLLPKSLVDLQPLAGTEEPQAKSKDQVSSFNGGWGDFPQTLTVAPLHPPACWDGKQYHQARHSNRHYTPTTAMFPSCFQLPPYTAYFPTIPPMGRGFSQLNPSVPGLIRTPSVISTPPQSSEPPKARDPFADLVDTSKLLAPSEIERWTTLN